MVIASMAPITLFSWGYWGWGNATPQLLEAVDAVEAARGFRPPLFVDVRISRSVRAVGFRDHAFEQLIGGGRYKWLRGLGNRFIETRTGPRLQIAAPAAAHELVDAVLKAASERRRVLFFCSCERPIDDQRGSCHRVEVARLFREAAAERDVAVQTVEWPGGTPTLLDLDVPPATFHAVERGRLSVPLGKPVSLAKLAGLAWGTVVRLHASGDLLSVIVGPARFQSDGWCLPVLRLPTGSGGSAPDSEQWAAGFRREHGYEPEQAPGHLRGEARPSRSPGEGRALFESCIYTIAHADKLRAVAASGGNGVLTESKRWVSGRRLLEDARQSQLDMPIVFADATDCSRLLFWAVLTRIDNTTKGTQYCFERLQSIRGNHAPQELALLSTGEKIAPAFIRPYALCKTPRFLAKLART